MTQAETTLIPRFLDMDLLARLPSLDLQARYLVEGFMTGMHRSPLRGHNVEFKEFRSYQVGDEPRTIDWKVYARSDRLHIKLREEETNLSAYLAIDSSQSMNFKTDRARMSKWQYTRSITAALLLLLHRQQDAASLALIDNDELTAYIPPTLRGSQLRRMMGVLDREANGGGGSLADGLGRLAQLVRRRSIVFVISDFYEDPENFDRPIGRLHYMGCEPVLIHVLDPLELDFDLEQAVMLEELETGTRMPISPDIQRKNYLERLAAHRSALSDIARRYGGDYLLLRTDESPVDVLGAYLARRKGML